MSSEQVKRFSMHDKEYVLSRDYDALAERLRAAQPKVWTAETIKDAPEGRYNFTTIIISGGDEYVDWEKGETASKGELLEDLADVPEGDLPKLKFHGPIPQPPETES